MYLYNKFNKNFKKKNPFFLYYKNFFSWHKKFLIWQFLYSGLYFDEMFSRSIKFFFLNLFNFSSFFFLDKWFSFWTGAGFFKKKLKIYTNFFYYENLDYFFFIIFLIIFIFLIIIFFFFFFLII